MARTKKQTIDAATERKRQFQVEIHNQTHIEITKKGGRLDSSSSENTNAKPDRVKLRPSKLSNVFKKDSSRMSSPSKSTDECNILPHAVVRVTDICKSPVEMRNEDSVRKNMESSLRNRDIRDSSPKNRDTRDSSPRTKDNGPRGARDMSPRSKETRDTSPRNKETNSNVSSSHKEHTTKNIFEVMEMSPPKKRSPKKTSSPSPKSKELEESLRALKSESERVRMEKSKKLNTEESPKLSPRHHQGRRSPRHQSPNSMSQSKISNNSDSPGERQKINIFTDDIGKDLGKRIRSPRRLSEDMIALPIFSLRAKGQSPKDCGGFSKYAEEGNSVGYAEGANSSNIFKSPSDINISPCKRASTQKSSEWTDSLAKQSNTNDIKDDSHGGSKKNLSSNKRASNNMLMSSICRDIIEEMTFVHSDFFMNRDEKHKSGDSTDGKQEHDVEKSNPFELGDTNSKDNLIGEAGDASCVEIPERSTEDQKKPDESQSSKDTVESDDVKPSLLCAMLVGDSHVVQDYSDQRERYNPEVTEISDSETEQSRAVSPNPILEQTQNVDGIENMSVEEDKSLNPDIENKHDVESVIELSNVKDECEDSDDSQKQNMEMETDTLGVDNDSSQVGDDGIKQEIDMISERSDLVEGEIIKEIKSEVVFKPTTEGLIKAEESDSTKEVSSDDSKNWKNRNIEFSSQLKKVNDNVLKLLDIDVEDQFMDVPNTEEIVKETASEKETKLYKLISNLSVSLKGNLNTPDSCEIDKIIDSCPKGSVQIVSSSFSDRKWETILSRLKHEKSEVKKLRHRLKREHMDADMENLVEKMSASTLQGSKEESHDNVSVESNPEECEKGDDQMREKKEASSSAVNNEKVSEQNNCLMSASCSSLNDSLCELDLDSMTNAATQALKIPSLISDSVSEPGTNGLSYTSEEKIPVETDKSDQGMRRRFQKSKTCGDFSQESLPPSPLSKSGTLRRTNSSPQLLKSDSRSNSPCLGKDQVKSKLGGKIPIPGTSYSFRSTKKTVRKPQIIMDTKPLDILMRFVADDKGSKDVFTSQELQKFLWMPSNRMIVTPAIRNEISIADKTAEEAWEKKVQLMLEEEERQRKKDEEVDQEYMKYEPGFDEVDGLLFMSFSSEAELLAHVRVEKALEWDKDDTMLRIARAKTFEETKAINGDMKGVKMKRLRGQHMRWKKYKRMYGNEVQVVLTAKEKNIPLEDIKIQGKTYDASKIKGWRKKSSVNRQPTLEAKENEVTDHSPISHVEVPVIDFSVNSTPECTSFQSYQDPEDIDPEKKEMSPKSRRQFNFSDRKAHKQLFKELNMDWEDRMIHRKLGGWSLKGNRPKEFSQAAKKRELKEIKALSGLDPSGKTHPCRSSDTYTDSTGRRRKLVFPLITERMARSCLQTLELSDDLRQAARRTKRKKRFRANRSINTRSSFPPDTLPMMTTTSLTSTPQSSVATAGSLEKMMDISTPEASVSLSESTINTTASPSLSLDLPEETVMEGVEIVSHASSPSITDSGATLSSPQVKSCSKPGCRYGCICHLLQSPISKAPSHDCSKEYCRLGCICDSLQSEQPVPSHQPHCGKPSCMLECFCQPNSGGAGIAGDSVEDNDDIPFLSSMKQRPRAGERFSNLPRREKTHRSAKNVDAITRKAMMLYETSEIYCEKVERVTKKKSDSLSSPPNSVVTSSPSCASTSFPSQALSSSNNTVTTVSQSELSEPPVPMSSSTVAFNAVNLITSEVATVTASHFHSTRSQLFPWRPRRTYGGEDKVDILMDEVRHTLPVVEPSAHKRKRKSHPLSDEIFSVSSCARIQPYTWSKDRNLKSTVRMGNLESSGGIATLPPASTSAFQSLPSLPSQPPAYKQSNYGRKSPELGLKISSVCSLVDKEQKSGKMDRRDDSATSHMDKNNAVVDLTISKTPPPGKCHERSVSVSKSVPGSRGFTLDSSSKKPGMIDMKDQEQNWHTSMVCLKARAAPKTNDRGAIDGDEIQEEDEVKLLEFAANCSWNGAKKEILSRVASCLTRGQYPQPRMLNVKDYVVEILPKAKHPSIIPNALRAKLPEQMYSIRVRITKRDDWLLHSGGDNCDFPVIDLSKPSPVKTSERTGNSSGNSSHVARNISDNFSSSSSALSGLPTLAAPSSSSLSSSTGKTCSLTSSISTHSSLFSSSSSASTVTDSSFRSSIGISGLNRICNINSKSLVNQTLNQQKSKSAPGSRRSSVESYKDVKLTLSVDDSQGTDKVPLVTAAAKPLLDLNKIQILSRSNPIGLSTLNRLSKGSVSTSPPQVSLMPNPISTSTVNPTKDNILVSPPSSKSSSTKTTSSPTTHPIQNSISSSAPIAISTPQTIKLTKKVGSTAATSLLNPDVALRKEKLSLKVPNFAVAGQSKSSISPTPVNELKYVQMLYEVDGQNEKKKTLIAVPISLTGANIDVKGQPTLTSMPILTVPKPGAQSKNLPVNINPQNKSKLPQVIPGAPVIMKMPQLNSTSKSDGPTTLKSLQIIPLSSMSSLLSKNTTTTKLSAVISSASTPSNMDSSVKNKGKDSVSIVLDSDKGSVRSDGTCQEGTSVTQSRNRPISSTEVLPPGEILPKTNGTTEDIHMSSSGNKHVSSEEIRNKNLDNQRKNIEQSFGESKDSCAKASITVKQNTNKTSKDVDCHIIAETSSLIAANEKNTINTKSRVLGLFNGKSPVSEQNNPAVTVDPTHGPSKSSRIESSKSTENRVISNTKECQETDRHGNKLSNENVDNFYEVVDIDDLIVGSTDILTPSEMINASCSSNKNAISSLDGGNEPQQQKQQQQSSLSGASKRRKSPEPSEELDCPPGSKKLRLITDISGILDEDSNLSSLVTASPQSYTSLQKGVFSSGMSSGSVEDVISSDEEIDVGEDTYSYQNRVEKAWENDHSSMFSKAPPLKLNIKGLIKHKRRENQSHDSKDRVEYHNLLERNRRAKLKELFDNLGNTIIAVQGGAKKSSSKECKEADGNYVMPKATILTEAKSTILYLDDKDRHGLEEIRHLKNLREQLSRKLGALKAQLLANNMSNHAIDAILEKVSHQKGRNEEEEEEEMGMEIKTESLDCDYAPEIEPNPTEQATPSPETNVIVDTFCASADLQDKSPTEYKNEADNVVCREAPVEQYELGFYPL